MEMKADNAMEVIFDAKSENESFARVTAAAFCTRLDPTVEEIADIKTAVSEAVTNSIVHGYEGIEGKMEPLYTTKPEQERSGMGFSFMEAFMDELKVYSGKNSGTTVIMKKRIGVEN